MLNGYVALHLQRAFDLARSSPFHFTGSPTVSANSTQAQPAVDGRREVRVVALGRSITLWLCIVSVCSAVLSVLLRVELPSWTRRDALMNLSRDHDLSCSLTSSPLSTTTADHLHPKTQHPHPALLPTSWTSTISHTSLLATRSTSPPVRVLLNFHPANKRHSLGKSYLAIVMSVNSSPSSSFVERTKRSSGGGVEDAWRKVSHTLVHTIASHRRDSNGVLFQILVELQAQEGHSSSSDDVAQEGAGSSSDVECDIARPPVRQLSRSSETLGI